MVESRWWGAGRQNRDVGWRAALERILSSGNSPPRISIEVAELERLRATLATLEARCAQLDAERVAGQREKEAFKHAFETTAADRDRLTDVLATAVNPLDAGFFQFDLGRGDHNLDALERLFESGDHQAMVASFLARAPVGIALPNEPAYFRPFAAYYMACLLIRRGESTRAKRYLDMIEFHAPTDASNFLPYDIRQGSRLGWYQQELAVGAGKPGAVITSLPKSASSFLSTTISRQIGIPVLRASLGERFCAMVSEKWVRQLARGGAVTHDHFPASAINLDALRQGGLRTLYVQIRDPRDAAYSYQMMVANFGEHVVVPSLCEGDSTEAQFANLCRLYSIWIEEWISASAATEWLNVEFVFFDEVTRHTGEMLARIFPGRSFDVVDAETPSNFRAGTGREWCDVFSSETRDAVWSAIPDSVKDLLGLEP